MTVRLRGASRADGAASVAGPRFLLGFVDVAGSSAASFSLGLFATKLLPAETLGVYALFFTGFLLGAVVPAQLLCVPAEIEALRGPLADQFRMLRRLAPLVVLAGALTAVLTVGLIALTTGTAHRGFTVLALTMIPTSALSPLQDHLRRLCHQAQRSDVAAGMSTVQVLVTVVGLVVLGSASSTRQSAPFGALCAANLASSAAGLYRLRRERTAFDGRRPALGELVRTGRWLTGAGAAQALGGLGSMLLVSHLAGVAAVGYAEAVRVLSQPVYVVAIGLMAVLNPVVFRARAQADAARERRAHRDYIVILSAASVLLLVVASRLDPINPLVHWFPTAYQRPWLLEATILGQLLFHLPLPMVTSLLARKRVAVAALGQMAGFPPQLLLASTAGALGAWAYTLGFVGAAIGRIAAVTSLSRWDGHQRNRPRSPAAVLCAENGKVRT